MDFSLEEALFDKSNKENMSRSSESYALPSPRLSKIDIDTSRSIGGVKPASSALRKLGLGKKNKRGLTVSFTQHRDTGKNTRRAGIHESSTSRGKFTRHATQRSIDGGLVDSLNASRYGAMEQRLSKSRQDFHAGGDPRLGYDWIAGLLDSSESYLSEKDDNYFKEMNEFRRVNYNDCHKPKEVM